jgi:diaminopimelate decarboxylase
MVKLTLIFEPGKFLLVKQVHFLVKVNVKQTTSFLQVWTIGFNHLIRPMLYGSQHQIENL